MTKHSTHPELPMPISPIWNAQTLAVADGASYRVTLAILIAFWRGGCRPLPAAETSLMCLARCSPTSWYRVRVCVMAALREIAPQLEDAHRRALAGHLGRAAVSRLGGYARAAKLAQARRSAGDGPIISDHRIPHATTPPRKAAAYLGDGQTDFASRKAAIGRERVDRQAGQIGLLSDTHARR